MHTPVFITGAARSGTTLLGHLIAQFEGVNHFSQPLPLLLVHLMRAFWNDQGYQDFRLHYPILDEHYDLALTHNDFRNFLVNHQLNISELREVFNQMIKFSGQYFKSDAPHRVLNDWHGGNFYKFLRHYFKTHDVEFPGHSGLPIWKEVHGEAFIPYFLEKGFHVLLIIRDPRDVMTSSYYGTARRNYSGQSRPYLLTLRQWRKSAAYIHQCQGHKNFHLIKYEDLIGAPEQSLNAIGDALNLQAPSGISKRLQEIAKAKSNSSFDIHDGITKQSIGRYKDVLSREDCQFTEAICFSEMQALGYKTHINAGDVSAILKTSNNKIIERENLTYYTYEKARQTEEINRWNLLSSPNGFDPTAFIFEANYNALKTTLKGNSSHD